MKELMKGCHLHWIMFLIRNMSRRRTQKATPTKTCSYSIEYLILVSQTGSIFLVSDRFKIKEMPMAAGEADPWQLHNVPNHFIIPGHV